MLRGTGRILSVFVMLAMVAMLTGCQSSYVRSAKIYMQQDDPENAKEVLQEGAEATPEDPAVWYFLGKVHAELKEWEQMNEAFAKAKNLTDQYDKDIKATRYEAWRQVFNAAVKPFNEGDFAKALEMFQTAQIIRPDEYETLKRIGLCQLQLEEFEAAEQTFITALEVDTTGTDVATRLNLLNIYFADEEWRKVLEMADEIIEIDDSRMGDVVDRMAIAYQQMEQFDEAIVMWDKVIELNPEVADFYFNKGRLLYVTSANLPVDEEEKASEMMRQSADAFAQAVELNPEDEESRKFLVNTLFRLQDWQRLVDVLEPYLFPDGEVKMLDNPNPEVGYWQRLAIAYANLEMAEEANIANDTAKQLEGEEGGA